MTSSDLIPSRISRWVRLVTTPVQTRALDSIILKFDKPTLVRNFIKGFTEICQDWVDLSSVIQSFFLLGCSTVTERGNVNYNVHTFPSINL